MAHYPSGSALRPRPGTPSWLAATHIFDHQRQEAPSRDIDRAEERAKHKQPEGTQEEAKGKIEKASAEPRRPDDERKVGGGHTATEQKK